jgi:hypothetical protein
VVGSDGTIQAIECADIFVEGPGSVNGTNPLSAFPVESVICKDITSGDPVQCANVSMTFELAEGNGDVTAPFTYTCGHSAGPCDSGDQLDTAGDLVNRNQDWGNGAVLPPGTGDGIGSATEIWAVDTACVIQLPGTGKKVTCSGNFGTPHALVIGPV